MNKSLNVILLKTNDNQSVSTPETGISGDRYVDYLKNVANESCSIESVVQINLLSFKFINELELSEKLKTIFYSQDQRLNYTGLIITSKQTVEAIDNVLNKIDPNLLLDASNKRIRTIVYCIGESTANKFRSMILKKNYGLSTNLIDIKLVDKSNFKNENVHIQNSKQLSNLVIADSDHNSFFFYPCSSIRKDDLTQELTSANIRFDELKVYETSPLIDMLNYIRTVIESYSHNKQATCLVFFSPSGADSIFNIDKNLANFILEQNIFFISIGPSTSKRLKELIPYLRVHELSSPSPESLVQKLNNLL